MPKISPLQISSRSSDMQIAFAHRYEAEVSSQGLFYVVVPDDQLEEMLSIHPKLYHQETDGVLYEKSRGGKHKLRAAAIASITRFLTNYANWKTSGTSTRELRIYYRARRDVSFVKGVDGALYANGAVAQKATGLPYPKCGSWAKTTGTGDTHEYAVALAARIIVKKTTTANNGMVSITYQRPDEEDDLGPEAKRLNEFVHMGSVWPRDEQSGPWLPYTEERASFFADALHAMAKLADRFDQFFGDGATHLLSSIAAGQQLIAPPKKDASHD